MVRLVLNRDIGGAIYLCGRYMVMAKALHRMMQKRRNGIASQSRRMHGHLDLTAFAGGTKHPNTLTHHIRLVSICLREKADLGWSGVRW